MKSDETDAKIIEVADGDQVKLKDARKIVATDLVASVRSLKNKAESNGFKMVSYLLNMAELEALDCTRALNKNSHDANGTQV